MPRVSSVTIAANKTSPQATGTAVTWTATPVGGAAPYSYKWWVYDGQTWSSAGWTASNTFAWTPATANAAYQVQVWARNAGNSAETHDAYAYTPFAIASTGVSSATISANKLSPQLHGTAITWTAAASGGTGPYQYKWWVYNGAAWTNSGWSGSNSWTWTPATANAGYQVMVWVKSAGNAADTYEAYKSAAFVIQ